ncbi:MAG: YqgQ family protein [Bacillaceae bacterium]|uniref:YqgQ family protein n=1 Tax=Alkalihalobacterium chitinilyticum TaxID=2980103 RepID=A0ABT5VER9_9BACI|nr:YqgQ family protein [Alkalihalobacterium chitinilyticum]MDE5413960.1 YqgQ family protein [Alkalihalobacterium chitinilyticum]MEB1807639.1 YqgQ family protein [Bacillaceae bacterium]
MRTFYDVQQLLKKYGTFIYTKNRHVDAIMMEEEIREMYEFGMLDKQLFQEALLILKKEQREEQKG